jgi:hypothetical protein
MIRRSFFNRVKVYIIPLLIIFLYQCSFSQDNKLSLNHPLNYNPVKKLPKFGISLFPDTLFVYGVMVQFPEDTDPNTTGNGRFDVSNNYPDSVDAPPHDSTYFVNHLEFLKNYYIKSSKGKLVISYRMIGGVRNLSKKMSEYSPRRTENLGRLGNLFFDTWTSVDSVFDFSGIDPSKSAFLIFHAGVGRDVDLVSQGIFQGELDLPSIYISNSTLKSIYGDTTQGFYTKEGLIIPSSSILPEQEYRVINTSFGDSYLELGLNGIITASIGSHLGLPDLFNTITGVTAIGRFGLMDGQSIFSYSGVFPPEPSAWEKQYLGWVTPIVVTVPGLITSKAASIDDGFSSVYKIYKSAKEYFLIENRNRDANKNGCTVYFINNGVRDSVKFTKDEQGFENGDIWKLKKNIVDVDELDWSLPGYKNDTADYQGGILIWDIDENVIDAKIASNTINNDINHKGVDLEEAKGSQDIGVVIATPLGNFISDGFFYDYWYNGNHYVPATVYKNEFTPTSIPNSKSYSNIDSRVCLRNFSGIDALMTFNYEQCSNIVNISGFPRFVGKDTTGNAQPIGIDYNGNGFDELFINVKDSLYGFRDNGNPIRVDMPNGFLKDSVSKYIVGYINNPSLAGKNIVGVYNNNLVFLNFVIDSTTGVPIVNTRTADNILTTPVMINASSDSIYAGMTSGKIAKLNTTLINFSYDSVSNSVIKELARTSALANQYSFIDNLNMYIANGIFISGQNASVNLVVNNSNEIVLNNRSIFKNEAGSIYSSPVIADINKDGNMEIIFTADNKVYALNMNGVVIDHFPFSVPGVDKISSGVSVADLNNDGIVDVIFGTADGRVYAYGIDGKIVPGFPLLTGKEVKCTPAIINNAGNFGIAAYSQDGYIYAWKTGWSYDSTNVLWKNYLKDVQHSNLGSKLYLSNATGPCLPKDKFYNWPNPVYGKTTNIRYFLGIAASSIKIKIMDLSGELVTTLNGTVNAGFDNEVAWDVSSVQSGIYVGVIEMEGGCGETASIKIAVVK